MKDFVRQYYILLLACLVAVLSILFGGGCSREEAAGGGVPLVKYARVEERMLPVEAELPGRITAVSRSEVRPQVDGIILERLFEEGAQVEKGQELYQIDPSTYRADYETAKAALAEAEARADEQQRHERRQLALLKSRAVSQQTIDNTISERKQALARVERARAELERAAINLGHTKILAHSSGRIGVSAVSPGSLVTANQQEPLAAIQQIDMVYVDMRLPGTEWLRLRKGKGGEARVGIRLENGEAYGVDGADGPEPLYGKPLFTDISVGEDTGTVLLRAIVENPEGRLLPGAFVTATLMTGRGEKALLVPQKSVSRLIGGSYGVTVLTPEKEPGLFTAHTRKVVVGPEWQSFRVVISGLGPGELVVAEGANKVANGQKVRGEAENIGTDATKS